MNGFRSFIFYTAMMWISAILIIPTAFAESTTLPILAGEDVVTHQMITKKYSDSKKGTVIAFLSAKCPCSASHEPTLKALYEEFHKQGFEFLGVHSNRDENSELTHEHFTHAALPFSVIEDGKGAPIAPLATALRALKTPHIFILSPTGEILYSGGIDERSNSVDAKKPYLKWALTAISESKPIENKETRVLGCVIKRQTTL